MKTKDEIRSQVTRAYGQAILKTAGCCASAPNSAYAREIGYSPEEVKVNESAAGSSMGCGNPFAFSGVRSGDNVLDLGAGAGLDLLIAAEKVGPTGRVIGVDMTPEMIATARANAAASPHRNIDIRKGLIEDLPVENETVDWVISNCVINLSPEKDKVFNEIYRVLKPGGHFSISDIVVSELPENLRENPYVYNSCLGGAISEQEYLDGLKAAGFTEVDVAKRVEFTSATINSLIDDALSKTCCLEPISERVDLEQLTRQIAGRVQSLNFVGLKPL
ncbi:MAG: arsenite methyltransferase [Candidatus Neomarinimicrobiota bacterium]